jgi:hypothetical protein
MVSSVAKKFESGYANNSAASKVREVVQKRTHALHLISLSHYTTDRRSQELEIIAR